MTAGRPKIELDWNEFDKLCLIQCTLEEIADWFECSVDTIERRCKEVKNLNFAEYFKKNSVGGKISLRRSQFKAANEGNTTMLVWLGKQYLGQRDKSDIELNAKHKLEQLTDEELLNLRKSLEAGNAISS